MQDESNHDQPAEPYAERLVVLQVLDGKRGHPPARLKSALSDIDPATVDRAIASLLKAGVITKKRTRLHPSPATRRLDVLTMICI
jgi:DNA-binding MarR family transcriptional regulator